MAYQRSPPSPASWRNHKTRKSDYIPSQRLRKSQSPSPRSSSGDPIPRRFLPNNNTPTDLAQKENNQEVCFTNKPTPTRSPALFKGEKNFMSPTISTSSKFTSSPRKNMSTERNDPFPRTNSFPTLVFADSTNLDRDNKLETSIESHASNQGSVVGDSVDLLRSSVTMDTKLDAFFHSQNQTHDPHFEVGVNVNRDDPGMSSFSSASSVVTATDPCPQPYNPKTNYLSPRPRFRHYKPRPRMESYLNGHKSSAGGEDEEEREVQFSRHEEAPYLDDDDDEYNHESDGADSSSSDRVEGISKTSVKNDSKKQPRRRFHIGLMLSSMIMAVLVSSLCLFLIDSPFMTLHASKKDESGYAAEELWMNISKSKPWNIVDKLREDWLIYSKSIFSEVISFVRESGLKETHSPTNSTFSDIMVGNFVSVNYDDGGHVISSGETDSHEQFNIIFSDIRTDPCFHGDINMNHVNSLKKDDVSPPLIEYDGIQSVLSESRGEDEVVGCGEDMDNSHEYVTSFDPPSDYMEENIKKVDTSPQAMEEAHDVELQDPVEDFPSLEDDGEPKLTAAAAEEVIEKGMDENNSYFVKLEEDVPMEADEIKKSTEEEVVVKSDFVKSEEVTTMEANEIEKSVEEELLLVDDESVIQCVDEQKEDVFGAMGATESTNLVTTIVCCVAIGAGAVATMAYKRRFVNRSAGVEGAGMDNMGKKKKKEKQKNKRESLSSSSTITTPSYGSFMRYEKITKKNSEEGAVTTPVRRSNRIRSQITSP